MTVLYLDTSSSYFYSAIYKDEKILASQTVLLEKDMSSQALPLLKDMLEIANIFPSEVDKIIVCNGPGSFTGIRIGITIAKVYAWALNKEITVISALEAMALSSSSSLILPIIDARRGYVYGALYNENEVLIEPGHYSLEQLLSNASQYGTFTVTTNNHFPELETVPYEPDYMKIIEACLERPAVSPHLVNPVYLKRTEAEEKLSS